MENDFDTLMNRLTPTIRRISHKLNGRFTFFNDDDLCQEALVHLWVAFRKGTLDDKTDSYILQGCYFHLKNHIRKTMDKARLTSFGESVDDDGTMLEEMIASNGPLPVDRAAEKTLYENVQNSQLDEREQKIVDMSLEGLTVRQIGKKLGISHVAVIKSRKKIRTKCNKLLYEIKRGYQN